MDPADWAMCLMCLMRRCGQLRLEGPANRNPPRRGHQSKDQQCASAYHHCPHRGDLLAARSVPRN